MHSFLLSTKQFYLSRYRSREIGCRYLTNTSQFSDSMLWCRDWISVKKRGPVKTWIFHLCNVLQVVAVFVTFLNTKPPNLCPTVGVTKPIFFILSFAIFIIVKTIGDDIHIGHISPHLSVNTVILDAEFNERKFGKPQTFPLSTVLYEMLSLIWTRYTQIGWFVWKYYTSNCPILGLIKQKGYFKTSTEFAHIVFWMNKNVIIDSLRQTMDSRK